MLTYLKIKNFAIIDEIELELADGMTVITGETGAGKSLLVDTLNLVLGDRADNGAVKNDASRCEITAVFSVGQLPQAQEWLRSNEFASEDQSAECIIQRIINKDGPSRCIINGTPATASAVKQLGRLLLDLHGQHDHHLLLQTDMQRQVVDAFAGNDALCMQIKNLYLEWQNLQTQYAAWQEQGKDQASKIELLNYQLQELNDIACNADELNELKNEHVKLSHAAQIRESCLEALNLAAGTDETSGQAACGNVLAIIHRLQNLLESIKAKGIQSEAFENLHALWNLALINVSEGTAELRHYLDTIELNDERLSNIESRLQSIYALARKHKVSPEELPKLHQSLQEKLAALLSVEQELKNFAGKIEAIEKKYFTIASKVSAARKQGAVKLNAAVSSQMQQLGMPHGKFEVRLEPNYVCERNEGGKAIKTENIEKAERAEKEKLTPHGMETISFHVSTNPDHAPRSLTKVASGGELSRISLALQVILADAAITPTLIFDEVDVGVGGKVAAIVGKSLRDLGCKRQVLCVTHLPQVASCGHHHIKVEKVFSSDKTLNAQGSKNNGKSKCSIEKLNSGKEIEGAEKKGNGHEETSSHMTTLKVMDLSKDARVEEIARMLGGMEITDRVRASAQEMLGIFE